MRKPRPKGGTKRKDPTVKERLEAIGINWMIDRELTEAIPPAYTEFIGKQIIKNA
jgi:DNA (cytosine-5)-methyltransferase 1